MSSLSHNCTSEQCRYCAENFCRETYVFNFLSTDQQYFFSCIMAVSVLMLLWTLQIVVQFYYGKESINKLTFRPFKVGTYYFTAKFISNLVGIYEDSYE